MAFTNNFRIERIYFEKLKSNIDILKSYIEAGATGEALELLKNSVDVNGAVLLLYRNLGEAWAELADLIQKTQKDLKDLAEKTEAYHDELNERIDEVNNYLMALIRELDARLQVVEQDLATMNRNKFYELVENNGSYLIEKDGETVSFDDIKEDVDFPHNVILRYDNGTSETELEIREYTNSRIDFYSIGLADSDKTVKEILVSIDNTEAVTYSENTLENPLYTFGSGLSLDSDNELSVDFDTVQGKLTEGTGIDIDSSNNISVDTSVIQEKLTEGTGIDIDSSNNISVDTSVIQEKMTEGFGIDIDSNNEIKVDTSQVQEKLIAGQNITLTPDTTDPTKTVIDTTGGSYTQGSGILITNNVISKKYCGIPFGSVSNITPTNTEVVAISDTTVIDNYKIIKGRYTLPTNNQYFKMNRVCSMKLGVAKPKQITPNSYPANIRLFKVSGRFITKFKTPTVGSDSTEISMQLSATYIIKVPISGLTTAISDISENFAYSDTFDCDNIRSFFSGLPSGQSQDITNPYILAEYIIEDLDGQAFANMPLSDSNILDVLTPRISFMYV